MKRLDKTQAGCLRNMVTTSKGAWQAGCGWEWGSSFKTEKVFDSLVSRGLVKKTGTHKGYGTYEITPDGLRAYGERGEFA